MIFSIEVIVDESPPGQTPPQNSSFQHVLAKLPAHHLQSDHRSGRHGLTGADGPAAQWLPGANGLDEVIISNTSCWFHDKLSSRNVKLTQDQDLSSEVCH